MKSAYILLPCTVALCTCLAQTITTVVGTGDPGFGGDGGPATRAQLNGQGALALDARGNLYLHDDINIRIRKVAPSGIITTVAGNGDISPTVEGPAVQTGFLSIYGFAALPDGTLYVADSDGLQKVNVAGNLGFVITDSAVTGIKVSKQGLLYTGGITVISQLNPDGTQKPIAGSDLGDSGDGGPATDALFWITDFTTDVVGDIYVLDGIANRVRKFTPGGNINAVAGNGTNDFSGDGGPATQAQLSNPSGIAVDVAGNVYIGDSANLRVRRVTTDGIINTIAGTGDGGITGDGGPALQATFNYPSFLAVSCGALYVSDSNSVRAITLTDPLIALRGITSTTTGGQSIRAGTNFQISGCNLAGSTAAAGDGGNTISLAGTSVKLNGVLVPVVSVSPTVVVAQVPFGFASGAAVVVLTRDGLGATAMAGTVVE